MIDKKLSIIDAFKQSFKITEGIFFKLFLFHIMLFLLLIGGFLALLVGLIVTVPFVSLATVVLYKHISSEQNKIIEQNNQAENSDNDTL